MPQPSSQSSVMGLTIRESLDVSSRQIALLLFPGKTGQVEAPDWHTRLLARTVAGDVAERKVLGAVIGEPALTFGRLTGYYWLRLQRKGDMFSGYTSVDGYTWSAAGSLSAHLAKGVLIGFSVSSGIPNSTTVFFDNVRVSH